MAAPLIALALTSTLAAIDLCGAPQTIREQVLCDELEVTFQDAVTWEERARTAHAELVGEREIRLLQPVVLEPERPEAETSLLEWVGAEALKVGLSFTLGWIVRGL